MKRFAGHAFLALLVLAMVPSVNCTFDGSNQILDDRISWSGCYEKEDGEERAVLNLKSLSLLGGEPGNVSALLSGCVWLQKNGLITVEFGEEEPMEDLQRQAEYVEVPICPTQCPQEEAP